MKGHKMAQYGSSKAIPTTKAIEVSRADIGHRVTKTVNIDIVLTLGPIDADADEFIISLNGRLLRRIPDYQAKRTFHLLEDEEF